MGYAERWVEPPSPWFQEAFMPHDNRPCAGGWEPQMPMQSMPPMNAAAMYPLRAQTQMQQAAARQVQLQQQMQLQQLQMQQLQLQQDLQDRRAHPQLPREELYQEGRPTTAAAVSPSDRLFCEEDARPVQCEPSPEHASTALAMHNEEHPSTALATQKEAQGIRVLHWPHRTKPRASEYCTGHTEPSPEHPSTALAMHNEEHPSTALATQNEAQRPSFVQERPGRQRWLEPEEPELLVLEL
ncbi:unnamed protein product [Symbiodinium sp. CCMP2592]|nr:unnamed protein product [Symbiodinium sp. CCMP2592]